MTPLRGSLTVFRADGRGPAAGDAAAAGGNGERAVAPHTVPGLTFEHSTWLLPSNYGYVSDQASIVLSDELPGDDQITSYPGIRLPGRSTWRRLTPRCSIGTCCGISGRRRLTTT
jgi:hypothetical protein